MSVKLESDPDIPDKWIQGGWWRSGTDHTQIFSEWVNQEGKWGRRFTLFSGEYDIRFAVYRNWAAGDDTWNFDVIRPSDGKTTTLRRIPKITTPMPGIQFFAETHYTMDRLWGRSGDRAWSRDLHYRNSSKVWGETYPSCHSGEAISHHRLTCWGDSNDRVTSFSTWDDRHP